MRPAIVLIAATAFAASPALAQMNMPGMKMPGMKMSAPRKKAPSPKRPAQKKSATHKVTARPGHAKRPVGQRDRSARQQLTNAHSDHKRTSMPGMSMPATTMPGMKMPSRPTQPVQPMQDMPGMEMPSGQSMPAGKQAGADMAPMNAVEPPVSPPPAAALQGPENAADTVYGTAAMQPSRTFLLTKEHGGMKSSKLLIDQLETRLRHGRNGYFVNAQAWSGGDIDKLWLKSEIEGDFGRKADQLEFQGLWSHALDPWLNLQTGVRFDAEPHARGRLVIGVEGLAPYWWEVDAAAFVSTKGDITARAEASHDVRITQKLILQPRAQLDFALQDIPSERVGSGLSRAEIGARLRYQFVPNFAPYIGVVYERAVGHTARFVRAAGEDPGGIQFTLGVRTWF